MGDGVRLDRGTVALVVLDPTVGHERRGTRPCVVVSDPEVNREQRFPLVAVVPVTGREGVGAPCPPSSGAGATSPGLLGPGSTRSDPWTNAASGASSAGSPAPGSGRSTGGWHSSWAWGGTVLTDGEEQAPLRSQRRGAPPWPSTAEQGLPLASPPPTRHPLRCAGGLARGGVDDAFVARSGTGRSSPSPH
ncbi:type II toxin-antitoxin system PemK/MazF family toxin [Myxococcota bacterium]|nr:type II toxin-antitoxin system PemK/MazF family toxin [Myxococcota bacterium]